MEFGHNRALLIRKHFRFDIGNAEVPCDRVCGHAVIPGQHDDVDAFCG
jgi:hypothetical protein